MRYLRMLTNSLVGGLLGAAYLTILVLQLNPHLALASLATPRWFGVLTMAYGIHLAVSFYVLLVLRELLGREVLSPGWLSVRLLAWMAAFTASAAAVLMWLNLRGFRLVLEEETVRRMTAGTWAMAAAAGVLLVIAVAHYSFGRRGSRVGAALFALAAFGSLALPLAARGPGITRPLRAHRLDVTARVRPAPSPRAILLLLDGASLEYLWPRAVEGRLPNFGRILDAGAAIDLATLRPTQPDPVWAAVATGMYPPKNGVRSAGTYRARPGGYPVELLPDYCFAHGLVHLGFVSDEPNTSAAWRARPLWSILSGVGVTVGVARWPVTYPAQPVRGFVLTDRFHQFAGSPLVDEQAAYPPEILAAARAAVGAPSASVVPAGGSTAAVADSSEATLTWPDPLYSRAAWEARRLTGAQVFAIRYQGLDAVGHRYLRYAVPRSFGDVSDEERRTYGQVLERYYAYIDGEVGRAIDALEPGDLLLVVSGFGMQPVHPVKHLLRRVIGDPDFSGTHEGAPDGFLLAYGDSVAHGRLPRGAIVDVTPTVLYFLGLPVGRDMDGYARADIFTPAFTAERPMTFIPSYDR
jgi:predicted AlkP superfamily phosphohydrolase/phosphomutase